jgi:PAS domain S-box-containing protein
MNGARPRILVVDAIGALAGPPYAGLAGDYAVQLAHDRDDALALMRAQAPDLVLARVAPPGDAALALLRAVRVAPGLRETPVLLIAERAEAAAVLDGFRAGADDYLVEPFDPPALMAHVAAALQLGRQRRETAASERQLAAIFNQAMVGITSAGFDGRFRLANQRFCAIIGRTIDEVLSLRVSDVTHPDDMPGNLAATARMLATGEAFALEKRYVHRDGSPVWVHLQVSLLRGPDGAPESAIAVVQDITERKRAEDALRLLTETLEQRIAARTEELADANHKLVAEIEERRQTEAALQREEEFSELVIESSTEAIVAIDTEYRHTLWNAAMEVMTGMPRAAMLGRTLIETFPERIGTPLEAAWRRALAGVQTSLQDYNYSIPQTGRAGVYDATFAPLHGADGAIIGALALLRDTTDHRRAEDALRQAQKMEAVGQLTGGVAHDFNNLLTVITGNIETLLRRLPDDARLHRLAEAALRGTERAATLTHRLLAFSRRQPLDPKPVEPNRLVAGMSDLLHRTLGETIAIETVVAADAWRIRCDPNQLESALLNLAVNARDAMPAGGKLMIETANTDVDAALAAAQADLSPGQYVVIAVTDTGMGMTKAVAQKAFEPFFTTKEVGQGTGLGLSQVYGFVKQSGGHVQIYSEPGQGTTIRLYLPRLATAADAPEVPAPVPVPPEGARHETVLVVEDDDDVRTYSVELLRELGYDVLEAADGPSALNVIGGHPDVRLLFTDVALPGGLNGRQLADAARLRQPAIKVLFTTGYARNAVMHHGALDPAAELIVKPFTYQHLAAKIREVLSS